MKLVNVKDISKLSSQVQYFLKNGYCYTTDSQNDSGYDDTIHVTNYDLDELKEQSIPETLEVIFDREHVSKKQAKDYIKKISKDYPYCVWLCSDIDDTLYYDSYCQDVHQYQLDGNACLLADLGKEGFLLALPKDISNDWLTDYTRGDFNNWIDVWNTNFI